MCCRSWRFDGVPDTGCHSSTHNQHMGSCVAKAHDVLGIKNGGSPWNTGIMKNARHNIISLSLSLPLPIPSRTLTHSVTHPHTLSVTHTPTHAHTHTHTHISLASGVSGLDADPFWWSSCHSSGALSFFGSSFAFVLRVGHEAPVAALGGLQDCQKSLYDGKIHV